MGQQTTIDFVFAGLTATSPLGDLQAAAIRAALRAAASDLGEEPEILASDAATVAMLRDAREPLEAWLGAYRHDEETLAALSVETREVAGCCPGCRAGGDSAGHTGCSSNADAYLADGWKITDETLDGGQWTATIERDRRAEVLGSAWLAYSATVMQARDAARVAAARVAS